MSFLSDEELRDLGLASYGRNVFISRKCSIYGVDRIEIGSDVRIDDFCVLSAGIEGIKIDSYVHVAVYSLIIGRAAIRISAFANISSRVSIYSSSDDYSGAHMTNPMVSEIYTGVKHLPVNIGRHVIIGSGSIVLPGVNVSDGVAIGALSLVNKDCEAFGIYAGIPVKRKGERCRDLLDLERDFLGSRVNYKI